MPVHVPYDEVAATVVGAAIGAEVRAGRREGVRSHGWFREGLCPLGAARTHAEGPVARALAPEHVLLLPEPLKLGSLSDGGVLRIVVRHLHEPPVTTHGRHASFVPDNFQAAGNGSSDWRSTGATRHGEQCERVREGARQCLSQILPWRCAGRSGRRAPTFGRW